MRAVERRLHKLEEIRDRNDVGGAVDNAFEKMGTSRAAMLADFGTLIAFRDWLTARRAAPDHPTEVQIVPHYRKLQGDSAASVKWNAIFHQYDAKKTAVSGA